MIEEEREMTKSPYEERLAEAEEKVRSLEALSLRLSWARGGVFITASALFFLHGWVEGAGFPFALAAAILLSCTFVILVLIHRRVAHELERWKGWAAISKEGIARMERRFDELQHIVEPSPKDRPDAAADLDILGSASLYRLTGGAYTEIGRQLLAKRLLHPASGEEVALRAELTAELRPRFDLLMSYRLLVHGLDKRPSDPTPFLKWVDSDPQLIGRSGVRWAVRVLSLLPTLLGLGQLLGLLSVPYWLAAMLLNLAFTGLYASKIHRVFDAVSLRKGGIEFYSALFEFMSKQTLTSKRGRLLQAKLVTAGAEAHVQMKKLERISSFADLRFSAMMYFPIQMLTLMDFHVLSRMENWQVRVGRHAEEWLFALGELEASFGIATFAHDNPRYTFPIMETENRPRFEAKALGHPLLRPGAAVTNDVKLGDAGEFLLVTGSNMSGKSSLLRSIGLNAAVASAGGAVFAESLTTSPFVLGTSFRVADSISSGISFFMAELLRLKEVVLRAERSSKEGPPLLYLLDEILQGTNIIERRIAVVTVLKHLLSHRCIGAISSHDLTLADAEGVAEHCRTVHFTESFRDGPNGREMHFEYRLHPGLAPTTNALTLLRMVGLGLDE